MSIIDAIKRFLFAKEPGDEYVTLQGNERLEDMEKSNEEQGEDMEKLMAFQNKIEAAKEYTTTQDTSVEKPEDAALKIKNPFRGV